MIGVFVFGTMFIGHQLAWLMGIQPILSYIMTVSVLIALLFIVTRIQSHQEGRKVQFGCLGMILIPIVLMGIYLTMAGSFSFESLFRSFSLPKLIDPWTLFVILSFVLTGFLFYSLAGIKKYTPYAREHLGQIWG